MSNIKNTFFYKIKRRIKDRIELPIYCKMCKIANLLDKCEENNYDYQLFKKANNKYKRIFINYWKKRYNDEDNIFFTYNKEFGVETTNYFVFKKIFSDLKADVFYCSDRLGDNERILRIADKFMRINTYIKTYRIEIKKLTTKRSRDGN